MSVSYNDFITSAKIVVKGGSEIDYRNAASRAYYGAYHEAERMSSVSNGSIGKGGGVHQKLINKLKTHSGSTSRDDEIRQIGVMLDMCKKQRIYADYRLQRQYTQTNACITIQIVDCLINISTAIP